MSSQQFDANYWKGTIETAKLIRRLNDQIEAGSASSEDLTPYLHQISKKAELKFGQSSQLSDELGLSDKLGLGKTPSYWQAVSDTVTLIKEFQAWKRTNSESGSNLDSLLDDIIEKAEDKLGLTSSPLRSALGISFGTVGKIPAIPATVKNAVASLGSTVEKESFIPKKETPAPVEEKKIPVHEEPVAAPKVIPKPIEKPPTPIPVVAQSKPAVIERQPVSIPAPKIKEPEEELPSFVDEAAPIDEKPTFIDEKPTFIDEKPSFVNEAAPIDEKPSFVQEIAPINEKPTFVQDVAPSNVKSTFVNEQPSHVVPNVPKKEVIPPPLKPTTAEEAETSLAGELLGDSDDDDELLSSSLRDALRMLREDEEEK